jgi:hypothetical protein
MGRWQSEGTSVAVAEFDDKRAGEILLANLPQFADVTKKRRSYHVDGDGR